MEMVKLESSAIQGCIYEEEMKELTVIFTDNTHRTFIEVPKKTYEDFIHAKSAGGYFNGFIRNEYKNK